MGSRVILWLKKHCFSCLLGVALVSLEIGWWLLYRHVGPPGHTWLGATIQNSTDQAIYLADIEQIRQGGLSMKNLFAFGTHQVFFVHPFYFIIGLLARLTGLSAILAHEIGRWIVTVISVFLIHQTSRRLLKHERDARWATGLIIFGGGLGWLGLTVLQTTFHWSPQVVIPDLTGETFFFPTLLMGAHIPLAWSLLVWTLPNLWDDLTKNQRPLSRAWLSMMLALLIHPYFAPLFVCFIFIATLFRLKQKCSLSWRILTLYAGAGVLALLPHLISFWLDSGHRFLLTNNELDLGPLSPWLLAFFPWMIALTWRIKNKIPLKEEERWILAWLLCVMLALLLPFHWHRKLTEGLGAATIWLTWPALARARDWLAHQGRIALIAAPIAICFSAFYLLHSQVLWASGNQDYSNTLFAPNELMQGFQWIKTNTSEDALVLADSVWVGSWTPAYTQRFSWLGPRLETPDWEKKRKILKTIFEDDDLETARQTLSEQPFTILLATTREHETRLTFLLVNTSWEFAYQSGAVTVWRKR